MVSLMDKMLEVRGKNQGSWEKMSSDISRGLLAMSVAHIALCSLFP